MKTETRNMRQETPTLGQILRRLALGEARAKRADRGPVDWWLVLIVLALVVFGLVMVYSASAIKAVEESANPFYYLQRQGVAAVLGAVGMVLLARIPTHHLARVGWVLYFACLLGLAAVFLPFLGHEANGATRWLAVGSLRLQPSEFMKLALVLVLAERVNRLTGGVRLKRDLLPIVGFAAPALVLVLLEPDFGTTVILAGIVGLVLFMGGIPFRWLAVLGGLAVAVGVPLVLTDPYRLARVVSWLNPWADPEGGGYQVIQGWVALHHGGFWGQGLGIAISKMSWLPFAHTDFVAAVAGEELGFAGLMLVLLVYGALVWRGVRAATRSSTYYGSVLAGCITAILGAQTLFNLGVIMGLVPPKGLVLPFMSYGASALIAHMWGLGVVLSVSAEPAAEAEAAPDATGGSGGGRLVPLRAWLGAMAGIVTEDPAPVGRTVR